MKSATPAGARPEAYRTRSEPACSFLSLRRPEIALCRSCTKLRRRTRAAGLHLVQQEQTEGPAWRDDSTRPPEKHNSKRNDRRVGALAQPGRAPLRSGPRILPQGVFNGFGCSGRRDALTALGFRLETSEEPSRVGSAFLARHARWNWAVPLWRFEFERAPRQDFKHFETRLQLCT